MQYISSQTTDGICIFTSRKWNNPILSEIKLPESLRTSLANTFYNEDCLYLHISPSFLFSKTIQLHSQAHCICSSGKWWKAQNPSTVLFCACRSAEPCLFSSASVFSNKQSSQGCKRLRISSFIADLLPTVTSNWHFSMSVPHLELSNPPPTLISIFSIWIWFYSVLSSVLIYLDRRASLLIWMTFAFCYSCDYAANIPLLEAFFPWGKL